MTTDAWITLGVVLLTIVLLARDFTAPAAVVFGAVVALLVAGVIEPAEAFSGFGNPAPITVAALYVEWRPASNAPGSSTGSSTSFSARAAVSGGP
jgi:hypothetical protein